MKNSVIRKMRADGVVTLDREANLKLYQRLQNGEDVVDEMVVGNVPLVFTRVKTFLQDFSEYSHLKDDLQSEAYLALINSVHQLKTTEVENPIGYIYWAIYNSLKKYIHRSESFGPTEWEIRTAIEAEEYVYLPQKQPNFDIDMCEAPDLLAAVDTLRDIEELCTNDTLKQVVWLRMAGYTDPEISEKLNIGVRWVNMQRGQLFEELRENSP